MKVHVLLLVPMLCLARLAVAEAPRFIDTQAQFDPLDFDYAGSLRVMLQEMDRVGISKTLIVPPPFTFNNDKVYDAEAIARTIGARTKRFGFLGGATLGLMILKTPADQVTPEVKERFRARCEAILATGALGFGEVTAEHLSLAIMKEEEGKHFHNVTAADHPLLLLLADIAAEKDVPIDIHIDIFPRDIPTPPHLREGNPPVLKENRAAFERLLSHNRKARINWAHWGSDPAQMRTPALMRQLLRDNPNLYSAIRPNAGPFPGAILDAGWQLKSDYRRVIEEFPERFTVHTDLFYVSAWPPRRGLKQTHEMVRSMLAQLPPDIANKLAHENAIRIYKLKE